MYRSHEFKQGRLFQLNCDPGDDYMAQLEQFVRDKDIRFGSIFLLGALAETGMISGFNSMQGYDVARHHFNDWRELVAYGNISWPDKPPAALGDGVVWTEPQPYIHIHMALSGGPGKNDEVLVGHLSKGILKGGLMTQVYELIPLD
jgi:predicted DNA-binding protein with PD1-like motif